MAVFKDIIDSELQNCVSMQPMPNFGELAGQTKFQLFLYLKIVLNEIFHYYYDNNYYYYYINVSMSALGVIKSCESLTKMLKDLDVEVSIQRRLISKIVNIAIRSTYFIFCRRNKDWTDPDLMGF